jgi:transposase-like protein
MSLAISFGAIEVLHALLDKTKVQTIRPAFYTNAFKCNNCSAYKVGDIVKLYWKMRSKAKWFCRDCGSQISLGRLESLNEIEKTKDTYKFKIVSYFKCLGCQKIIETEKDVFPKLLGTVKITEVFEIEMGPYSKVDKRPVIRRISDGTDRFKKGERFAWIGINGDFHQKDGFKSSQEMFAYFDRNYDLSSPKTFEVRRWEWL